MCYLTDLISDMRAGRPHISCFGSISDVERELRIRAQYFYVWRDSKGVESERFADIAQCELSSLAHRNECLKSGYNARPCIYHVSKKTLDYVLVD